MPYCAVFNCKSNSKVDKNVSWFRFPRADLDQARYKSWIHYCCRKDFMPTTYSRICSHHFTSAQYSRDPAFYAMYGYEGAKPTLRNDAVPDVQWDYTRTSVSPVFAATPSPKARSAVQKRRRIEILQEALHVQSESTNIHVETEEHNDMILKKDINIQTNVMPNTRTRRVQVGRPLVNSVCVSVGIQCNIEEEMSLPCRKCKDKDDDEMSTGCESEDIFDDSRAFDNTFYSDVDYYPDETHDFTDDEDDELMEDEDVKNYRLSSTSDPNEEKFYVVSETSLLELLSTCKTCHQQTTPIIDYSRGTMICVLSLCNEGHINKWTSQSMHAKMPWFNLFLSSAILSSGCNISKVLRCLNQARLQSLSVRTVSRIQGMYTIPATIEVYKDQQKKILDALKDKPHITLGGDGRCDSPGYSAKYGSYSLMDLETNKIVDLQLIQCNEVDGSTHMELEGLKRGLAALHKNGIAVQDLVTDRHVMIKSYMKRECPSVNHYFDVWHITKGISKKLEAVSKRKGCDAVRHWIRSIVNHCYWVAATSNGNPDLTLEKWKSVTNHISNKHSHDSQLFPNCVHGEVEDLDWLISGSRCHKLVKEVVESPYLLKDIPKLSPVHQTYGLEVFHSVVNQFAPKSTHFFHSAMLARLYTAAMHFNENGKRVQATRQDGTVIWYSSYPKAKKGTECVVKPKRVPPTYDYIDSIRQAIVQRRVDFPSFSVAREDICKGHKAIQPLALTASYEKFNKDDLIAKRVSRFVSQ